MGDAAGTHLGPGTPARDRPDEIGGCVIDGNFDICLKLVGDLLRRVLNGFDRGSFELDRVDCGRLLAGPGMAEIEGGDETEIRSEVWTCKCPEMPGLCQRHG